MTDCKHPSWLLKDGEMVCSQCGIVWTDETMGPAVLEDHDVLNTVRAMIADKQPHPAIDAIHDSRKRSLAWPGF